jgi:MFS family permease
MECSTARAKPFELQAASRKLQASQLSLPTPSPATRRKLLGTLFASAGLSRTGFLLSVTVTTLVAREMLGSATWAGLPVALSVVGIAVGTRPMSAFMARHGRRAGISVGGLIAAGGALLAVVATNVGGFVLLVAGLFVLGLGASGDRLARYAAADISDVAHTGRAIAFVVWAGTVGSVLGPTLLAASEGLAERLGWDGLSGAYLVAAVAVALAAAVAWIFLRPDPLTFAPAPGDGGVGDASLRELVGNGTMRFALAALAVGQVMMVLIMVMTPIHIRDAGGSLSAVGLVIGAHTLGMFALSPVSGWLTDRFGSNPVVVAGLALLSGAGLVAASAGGGNQPVLVGSLFVLGLGWSLEFVAGSTLVVEASPGASRLRVQGVADSFVWISGAVASAASGVVLVIGGYGAVSLVAASLVLIPLVAWSAQRTPEPASS